MVSKCWDRKLSNVAWYPDLYSPVPLESELLVRSRIPEHNTVCDTNVLGGYFSLALHVDDLIKQFIRSMTLTPPLPRSGG